MKKILVILFFSLFCYNYASASLYLDASKRMGLQESGLKKPSGPSSVLYNTLAKKWKKYMYDTQLMDFLEYCRTISASSSAGLIQQADCMYKRDVKIIRQYGFDTKFQMETLYSTYQTYRGILSVAAIDARFATSKSNHTDIIANALAKVQTVWVDSKIQQWELFHRETEREVSKILEKEKDNYPEINDNEVLAASSGTGFFVSKQGHMITNHHVISGCNYVKAIYEGEEYDLEILASDKINDLAIIKSNIVPKKTYSVSNKDAKLLEPVIIAGYPLGKKISQSIKATSGTVTSLSGLGDNYAEFQTDAALNSGNSGGPIIDNKGNVVGVAVSKWQEQGVESFNFGIKSSILKIFANANNLEFLEANKKELNKESLGTLVTEGTVYLECWMTGKKIKELISKEISNKAFYSKFN
tara:strand:+ start:93 stop:1334 length:1242 start_codon:yes stop_codon:yes gene_type:complete